MIKLKETKDLCIFIKELKIC